MEKYNKIKRDYLDLKRKYKLQSGGDKTPDDIIDVVHFWSNRK
jgi:hypothetical protein